MDVAPLENMKANAVVILIPLIPWCFVLPEKKLLVQGPSESG